MDDAPGTTAQTPERGGRWALGGLFVEAVAKRDFFGMADCLDPDARLRALLPPGPVEVTGRDGVVEMFRRFFERPQDMELVDASVGEVGSHLYLRWRLAFSPSGTDGAGSLVEQHVFATTGERIATMDLLCSGFIAQPSMFAANYEEGPCLERQ